MCSREWDNLSSEQEKYLLQVRGPHDTFQYTVRALTKAANISTAAILYDDSFGKFYQIFICQYFPPYNQWKLNDNNSLKQNYFSNEIPLQKPSPEHACAPSSPQNETFK